MYSPETDYYIIRRDSTYVFYGLCILLFFCEFYFLCLVFAVFGYSMVACDEDLDELPDITVIHDLSICLHYVD